jgi:hypothetical protein
MSDSTEQLTFLDPRTFKPTKTVTVVTKEGEKINWINEMEYIKGYIFANHFLSQGIASRFSSVVCVNFDRNFVLFPLWLCRNACYRSRNWRNSRSDRHLVAESVSIRRLQMQMWTSNSERFVCSSFALSAASR